MRLWKLFYVSAAAIDYPVIRESLDQCASDFQEEFTAQGITGALIYSGTSFAHVLEGQESALGALKSRIESHPTHGAINYLYDGPLNKRRFEIWSVPLARPSHFVAKQIAAAQAGPSSDRVGRAIDSLEWFMAELVRPKA